MEPITDGKEPDIDVAAQTSKKIVERIEKTMKSASYKEKLQLTPQTVLPKPLVKTLTKQCLVSEAQTTSERFKRSRLVLKPMDNEMEFKLKSNYLGQTQTIAIQTQIQTFGPKI